MWLSSGAEFAGYTIDRMLGFGATGEVYLAQRSGLARHDALKVLSVALSADPEFRGRFTAEAEIATTLHHPHIVDAHERGEFDALLWTAMDYIDGDNAATVVAQRYPAGMPVGLAVGIVAAVAAALDYAHRRGMLHRGVKPTNILLPDPDARQQRVLLGDFGIARNGVDDFAAPEQIKGLAVSERTDQYGLAATAYFLLCGVAPGAAGAVGNRLGAIPRIGDRRPELAALDAVLATALAENPDQRFDKCSAFAAALSERAQACTGGYAHAVDVVDYPDDAEPRSSSGPGRSALTRRWPIALAAALVVLGVCGGILIGRGTTSSNPVANPPTQAPVPAGVPTSAADTAPAQLLDGTYQFDVNRAQQTYNDNPAPQPPNVSTWWALRSRCAAAQCIAGAVQLDDGDHQQLGAPASGPSLVFDFHSGAWQSRPQTAQFACVAKDGSTLEQTTVQSLVLRPQASGPMRGEMTVTVESNECGQQGGKFSIPTVAGRTGPVPPDVVVPLPDR